MLCKKVEKITAPAGETSPASAGGHEARRLATRAKLRAIPAGVLVACMAAFLSYPRALAAVVSEASPGDREEARAEHAAELAAASGAFLAHAPREAAALFTLWWPAGIADCNAAAVAGELSRDVADRAFVDFFVSLPDVDADAQQVAA